MMINALICINIYVITCINSMLSDINRISGGPSTSLRACSRPSRRVDLFRIIMGLFARFSPSWRCISHTRLTLRRSDVILRSLPSLYSWPALTLPSALKYAAPSWAPRAFRHLVRHSRLPYVYLQVSSPRRLPYHRPSPPHSYLPGLVPGIVDQMVVAVGVAMVKDGAVGVTVNSTPPASIASGMVIALTVAGRSSGNRPRWLTLSLRPTPPL